MHKEIIKELLFWFDRNQRDMPWRKTKDLYSIWISEIMLQQTQVSTVIPYYQRFLSKFPNLKTLASASEEDVLKYWEGLGYYSRARNLHRATQLIESQHKGHIPDRIEQFQKLPGVGPYVAAAVFSISRGIPVPAVDGNVMRVFCRFKALRMDIRKPQTRKKIFSELQDIIPQVRCGDFNQALMELGSRICKTKNPKCLTCPLNTGCRAYRSGKIDLFPVKSPRSIIPEFPVSIAVIIKGDQFYIQKRPSRGHLGGLWEFPGGKARSGESPERALKREIFEELGIRVDIKTKLASIKHAYTHFRIKLSFFICEISGDNRIRTEYPFQWISIHQIKDYPFPGANHKFFPLLRTYFTENYRLTRRVKGWK